MKKTVKDYDPKKSFGYFAEIMNANAALDMKQNNKKAVVLPQPTEQNNSGGNK